MISKLSLIIFILTVCTAEAQRGNDQEMNFDKERARMQLAAEGLILNPCLKECLWS